MKCEEKELLKVIAMNTEENYCSLENKENRNEKTQSLEENSFLFSSSRSFYNSISRSFVGVVTLLRYCRYALIFTYTIFFIYPPLLCVKAIRYRVVHLKCDKTNFLTKLTYKNVNVKFYIFILF